MLRCVALRAASGCSRQTAVAFRVCTESDALYCAHSRFTHAIGAHCAVPCHARTVSSVNTKQEKATELTNLVGWVVRMECLSETDRDEMLERVSCSGTAHRCGLHIASTSVAQSLLALARRRRAATAFRTDWAEYSTCRFCAVGVRRTRVHDGRVLHVRWVPPA